MLFEPYCNRDHVVPVVAGYKGTYKGQEVGPTYRQGAYKHLPGALIRFGLDELYESRQNIRMMYLLVVDGRTHLCL